METKKTPQQTYYEKNREHMKELMRINYRQRCEDNDFKQKEKQRINDINRNRYYNDPDYKEKVNAKRRELYYKRKAEKMTALNVISIKVEA